jgi:hypothetical protein
MNQAAAHEDMSDRKAECGLQRVVFSHGVVGIQSPPRCGPISGKFTRSTSETDLACWRRCWAYLPGRPAQLLDFRTEDSIKRIAEELRAAFLSPKRGFYDNPCPTFPNFRERNSKLSSRSKEGKSRLEVRQILLKDLPNNLYVDIEIVVDNAISQADDLAPLDLGELSPEILRQAVGCFADDSQISHTTASIVLSSFTKVSRSNPAT